MYSQLQMIAQHIGVSPETLLICGIVVGLMLLFFGLSSILFQNDRAAQRFAVTAAARHQDRRDRGLLKAPVGNASGIMRSFLPSDMNERTELYRQLAQAGFTGADALRNFTLVRVMLGLVLPGVLLLLIFAAKTPGITLTFELNAKVAGLSRLNIFQIITFLVAAGYFLPLYWVRGRAAERRHKITEGFPNALDLMQISVEAGLGSRPIDFRILS